MTGIQAGKLRKRIAFLAPQDEPDTDAVGQPKGTEAPAFTVYGELEALAGKEFWQAQQAQVVFSHRLTIRWTSRPIAKNWRALVDGKRLNVQIPPRDPDGRRRVLEVLCLEIDR